MGTEFTKHDRTVGDLRPVQLPRPNQVTVLHSCWSRHLCCGRSVPVSWTDSHPFSSLISLLRVLLAFTLLSDHWTAACRSPSGRAFLTSFTVVCGGGRTSTATMSCEPLRPVSMPSTSKRTRCASTLTTTRG